MKVQGSEIRGQVSPINRDFHFAPTGVRVQGSGLARLRVQGK